MNDLMPAPGGNILMRAMGQIMPQSLLGTGMAQNAATAINSRAYKLHVLEAQALGQTPMSPEQFAMTQAGKQ